MRRRVLTCALILAAIIGTALTPPEANAARKWARGSVLYFSNDQACRDGMIVTVAYLNPPDTLTTTVVALGARLYTNTNLALPATENFTRPVSFYGPLLVGSTPITATRQATPLEADTDGNGANDQTFTLYKTGVVVPWTEVVPVSSTVLIFGSNGTLPTPVEDCFVNRPSVASGATLTIGPDKLKLPDSFTDPSAAVYRIDALPAHGALRLNGAPLAAGGTFTQADVDAGLLSYAHGGGAGATDSFSYTLSAVSRASVSSAGAQAGSGSQSRDSSITYEGSAVAFESNATNLVSGDTNSVFDIFYHSQASNQTLRASVRFNSGQGENAAPSLNPSISPDGNLVAYESDANNLTSGSDTCENGPDTNVAAGSNNGTDIFKSFLSGGVFTNTQRLSISSQRFGSCDGGDADSTNPSLDSIGRVAFESQATNLLNKDGGSDTNQDKDIYYRTPTLGGTTDRLSITSGFTGNQVDLPGADTSGIANTNPALAADSAWVAFDSATATLVAGDSNGFRDVFVRGINSPYPTRRISVNSAGQQATGGPGSGANIGSWNPSISADGRYVAFQSTNTNLDSNISDNESFIDIFVRDRDSDADGVFDEAGAVSTTLISRNAAGQRGNGASQNPAISPSGRYVAFESDANNLVAGDTNGKSDIFVYDLLSGQISRASLSAAGAQATGPGSSGNSQRPAISADGSYVAFDSSATNLVAGDTNAANDVFVYYSGFSSTFPITVTGGSDGTPTTTTTTTTTTTPTTPTTTPTTGDKQLRYLPVILK